MSPLVADLLPVAVVLVVIGLLLPRARRQPRRRETVPQIESGIAVGSLAGIAPRDIGAHVLLVVTHDGAMKMSGTVGCDSLRAHMLAAAAAEAAQKAFAEHAHGGEAE